MATPLKTGNCLGEILFIRFRPVDVLPHLMGGPGEGRVESAWCGTTRRDAYEFPPPPFKEPAWFLCMSNDRIF